MVPAAILDQISDKCTEGLALALASPDDGAIMELQWCNKPFTKVTGYTSDEALGQRGTILIGPDLEHGVHLFIIEKLMNWENFQTEAINNRKCGEPYFQRMTWTHLSDPDTGDRWWLCSIIDLGEGEGRTSQDEQHSEPMPQVEDNEGLSSKVHTLELENARLHKLAKSVAKDANEDALPAV